MNITNGLKGRVLVTGVRGFLGLHVLAPLRKLGYEVHGTARQVRDAGEIEGLTLHEVDLLEPGSVRVLVRRLMPTHLLHLAWISQPGSSLMSVDNLDWVVATIGLFRDFVRVGGRRAVFAGSCAEYDWSQALLREGETPERPGTLYGLAKNAAREVILKSSSLHGPSAAWARIFFLYGPHEKSGRLVADVARALVSGVRVKTTAGMQQRDFMHISDAGAALVKLLDTEVTGTVNVASGACVPVRRVVEILGGLSGRADLIELGGLPTSVSEPSRLAADIGRLSREVGFSPEYSLEDGLRATLDWWRMSSGVLRPTRTHDA